MQMWGLTKDVCLYLDLEQCNEKETNKITDYLKTLNLNRVLFLTRYDDIKNVTKNSLRYIKEFLLITDKPKHTFKVTNLKESSLEINIDEHFPSLDLEKSGINIIFLEEHNNSKRDIAISVENKLREIRDNI